MALTHFTRKLIALAIPAIFLTQCQSIDYRDAVPTSTTHPQITEIISVTPANLPTLQPGESETIGCTLPSTKVSNLNIRYFYWSENGEAIIYRAKDGQAWHNYNVATGNTVVMGHETSVTPTIDGREFEINDYEEIFLSPDLKAVIFTRGTPEKYDLYYKTTNGEQEYYLGTVQGYIKKIDWLSGGNNAIIAMDWQSPVGVHAYIYKANLLKKELEIEIPSTSDYSNVEYLGVTPDESNIMFVSYLNKIHLDRRIKLWNILTDNVVSTPIFNPLSFKWITQNEFISVGYQDPELFPLVSVLIFNVDNSETVYLANAKFSIDPFIINAQLSPDGSSIAYIENKTDNLYWTKCIH